MYRMYRCEECGHLFEEGEQKIKVEENGEKWQCCPLCGGDFEEAETCEICGAAAEELHGGVCDECIKEHSNFKTCVKISEKDKEEIKINSFLAEYFSTTDIERILYNRLVEIERKGRKIDCTEFIGGDKDWFGEQIARLK